MENNLETPNSRQIIYGKKTTEATFQINGDIIMAGELSKAENPFSLDKDLLREAIKASLDLQHAVLDAQEDLRKNCDPKTCKEATLVSKWGRGFYACDLCGRR